MSRPSGTRLAALLALIVLFLTGCERPPVDTVQAGYRGTGMLQVYNPRTLEGQAGVNAVPAVAPAVPAAPGQPLAGKVLKNVQVLGDQSVAEFGRTMNAITEWVSPQQGCAYCHIDGDFADDSKYTKIVSRRMLQMTKHINVDWKNHVAGTGVTCYTCHRGNPVPSNVWFKAEDPSKLANFIGDLAGQNIAAKSVGLTSLPYDPFTPYLYEARPIAVNGKMVLAQPGEAANRSSLKQTEHTYGLMMHMSDSLGVNCTYCHNTRAFGTWEGNSPKRVTAWYGIRMARDLNTDYMKPLTANFPVNRLGPGGDVAKVNCATCHQGAYKPLYGAAMAQHYPALVAPAAAQAAALPPPLAEAMRSVLYFGVASATFEGEQVKGLAMLIMTMTDKPKTKATVSGYHSAAGELSANQELAKQRAFSVRDALLAAGVAANRVTLDKPVQTEANLSGEDPAARRVEVTVR